MSLGQVKEERAHRKAHPGGFRARHDEEHLICLMMASLRFRLSLGGLQIAKVLKGERTYRTLLSAYCEIYLYIPIVVWSPVTVPTVTANLFKSADTLDTAPYSQLHRTTFCWFLHHAGTCRDCEAVSWKST